MIKGFFKILPLLVVFALDAGLTLLAQPPGYGTTPSLGKDAHPLVAWLLGLGPRGFLLGMGACAGLTVLLTACLPGFLGQAFFGTALVWHAFRCVGRLAEHGAGLAASLAGRVGTGREALMDLSRDPRAGFWMSLACTALLTGLTLACWRLSGVLAPAKAAPKAKAKDGKKDKKEKD